MKKAMKLALEALINLHYDKGSQERQRLDAEDAIKALEEALAKQELGGLVAKYSDIVSNGDLDPRNQFHTTPQQRKPLTDEQLGDAWRKAVRDDDSWSPPTFLRFARAIEAAHGIKE